MNAPALLYGKNASTSSDALYASSRFSPRTVLLPVVLALSMALAHPGTAQTSPADSAAAGSLHDSPQEYVELKSGERVYGSIVLKTPPFDRPHFLVNDSLTYERRAVRIYRADSVYHRRTADDAWAQLVDDTHRLNLWTASKWQANPPPMMLGSNGTMQSTGMPSHRRVDVDYFSTDDGPVQKVSYGNLKPVFQGHPESMRYLKQHRTLRIVQYGLFATGLAITFGSMIAGDGGGNVPTGVYIGVGMTLSSWIPHLARQGKLRQAIDTYNDAPAPSH